MLNDDPFEIDFRDLARQSLMIFHPDQVTEENIEKKAAALESTYEVMKRTRAQK